MSDTNRQDRFTAGTRNAINLARRSVMNYKHTHITPEHIFLGILQLGDQTVIKALDVAKASPEQIRQLVTHHLRPGADAIPEKMINFSERSKRVIEAARDEAARQQAPQIGPEHLLIGLTRVSNTICGAVLRAVEVSTEALRKELNIPEQGIPAGGMAPSASDLLATPPSQAQPPATGVYQAAPQTAAPVPPPAYPQGTPGQPSPGVVFFDNAQAPQAGGCPAQAPTYASQAEATPPAQEAPEGYSDAYQTQPQQPPPAYPGPHQPPPAYPGTGHVPPARPSPSSRMEVEPE